MPKVKVCPAGTSDTNNRHSEPIISNFYCFSNFVHGAAGDDDAWRLWEITVQNGVIINVLAVNDYVNDVESDDTSVFRPRVR